MNAASRDMAWLRFSLVFVWLATAGASIWELNGQSTALLVAAGIDDPALRRGLILGGAALDALLGLLLWLRPTRAVYLAALAAMLGMTVVATVLLPALWQHPLGPLTKNLPIAAGLWLLAGRRT